MTTNPSHQQDDRASIREGSFIRVVFPFAYGDPTSPDRVDFSGAVAASRANGWAGGRNLRPFLLPHVAEHITADDLGEIPPQSHIAQILGVKMAQVKTLLGRDTFVAEVRNRHIGFSVSSCDLALFRFGIGFLSIEVIPDGDEAGDWNDLLHHLRFYEQPGSRAGNRQCAFVGYGDGPQNMRMVIDTLLRGIASPYGIRSLWRPGQMFGYVSVVLDGPSTIMPDELFSAYYRFRRFFHRDMAIIVTEQRPEDLGPSPLRYGEQAYLLHSLDGGGFVCIRPPTTHFFSNVIHEHARGAYFTAFVVAMHLRLLLTRISSELIGRWTKSDDDLARLEAFTETKRQLIDVVARCSFVQIMQTDNHHASYRRWLDVLDIKEFQDEVTREARDMHDYLYFVTAARAEVSRKMAETRAARAERTFTIAGLGFAASSLVLAVLGVSINGWTVATGGINPWPLLSIVGVALSTGVGVGYWIVARNERRSEP